LKIFGKRRKKLFEDYRKTKIKLIENKKEAEDRLLHFLVLLA